MDYIIGLNSGSSCDGLDVVLAKISMAEDHQPNPPEFVDGIGYDWPPEIRDLIWKAFYNQLQMAELCRLNYAIGAVFAQAANQIMAKNGLQPENVYSIGVDGQQIYLKQPDHEKISQMSPEEKADLPGRWLKDIYANGIVLGDSSVCAAHTNVTTVTTFRPSDHAIGGNGAPMMQYLDYVLFRNKKPIMTLNIGGIANVHLVYKDRRKMMAFDTGPGNIMVDYMAKKYFGKNYDPDGQIAAQGKVCEEMLSELIQHPYFSRKLPRSAWRTDFDTDFSEAMRQKYPQLSDEDVMATYADFTAYCIVKNILDNIPAQRLAEIDQLVASGGGVRNKTMMQMIQARLPKGIELITSDAYGIPPQYKEALKFATLAYATLHRAADNIPAASHAGHYTLMGKIALAPRYALGTQDE